MSEPTPQPQITLYWLEESKAQRILWLLEELGLKYDLKIYKRVQGLAPPELKEINGLGKAPIVVVKEEGKDDVVLHESGFVTEWLVDRFGATTLRPAPSDEAASRRYKFHLYYSEGGIFQPMFLHFILDMIRSRAPFFVRPIFAGTLASMRKLWLDGAHADHLSFLERELEKGEYLAGDAFSGADTINAFNWDMAEGLGILDAKRYPKLVAYIAKVRARPAYTRAKDAVKDYKSKALN